MWINTLIHPGVTSVRIAPDATYFNPAIPHLVTSAILSSIDKACPRLQELTLYPAEDTPQVEASNEELYMLNILDLKPLFHYFGTLRCLHKLETSPLVFKSEILQALGELPLLEHLAISFLVIMTLDDQPPVLRGDVFPALKHLTLSQPSTFEAQLALNLGPMLQNLTSLSFEMLLDEDEDDEGWVTSAFFPSLLNIPHLTDLNVEIDYEKAPGIFDYLGISTPAVYDSLSKLPLRTLSLSGLRFDDDVDLTAIFPSLTKLQLCHQYGGTSNIWSFATIPKLEHLVLRLGLLLECETDAVNRGPACPSLHTLGVVPGSRIPTEPYWINQEAEYVFTILDGSLTDWRPLRLLLDLWPNLQQVVWEDPPHDVSLDDPPVAFNAHLSMLRGLRSIRAHIVENCGPSVADELMPEDFPSNAYKAFK